MKHFRNREDESHDLFLIYYTSLIKDRGYVRSHGKSGRGVRQKLFTQVIISDHLSKASGVFCGMLASAQGQVCFINTAPHPNPTAMSWIRRALIIDD